MRHSLKIKAEQDVSERRRKLIYNEMTSASSENVTSEDISSFSRSIYNSRKKIVPPKPKSIFEVHDALSSIRVKTNDDEQFLLVNDKINNIILFSEKSFGYYVNLKDDLWMVHLSVVVNTLHSFSLFMLVKTDIISL